MKGRLGKTGLLLLALVLVLGLTGAGFAKWSQVLTISGTVETGELIVGIRDAGTLDPEGTADPQQTPGHNDEGKDVASTISTNGAYKCTKVIDGEEVDFYHDVTENISNVYPYYRTGIDLWFGNCGTIPAKIDTMTFDVSGVNLMPWIVFTNWSIDLNGTVIATGTGRAALEEKLVHYQLEPCNYLSLHVEFYFEEEYTDDNGVVHVLPQGATMIVTVSITWSQWNEVP